MPINNAFNIKHIEFEQVVIEENSIKEMINQITNGYCDNLFYSDVDNYFSNEFLVNTKRHIAIRYVDEIMTKNKLDTSTNNTINEKNEYDIFSVGEINMLHVFILKNSSKLYYDISGNIKLDKLEKLKDDIKKGLWDEYFDWDIDVYANVLAQKQSAFQLTRLVEEHQNKNINNNAIQDIQK